MAMNEGVVNYFDNSAAMWERLCGDHRHFGYYGPGDEVNASDLRDGQIRMITEVLKFAGISDDPLKKPKKIVDVGCWRGETGRYLVKKYGATCSGIDLCPAQIQRAQELTVIAGLEDKMSFIVGDAVNQPFSDGEFDLVWAFDVIDNVDSAAHRLKFISELACIAAPGASIIVTTTCLRDLSPEEESLKPDEKNLLDKICKPFHRSIFWSPSDFINIAQSLALQDIKVADWLEHIKPFINALSPSNRTWWGLILLALSGWKEIKRAFAFSKLIEGFNKKLTHYTVIACRKPK